MEHRDDVVRGLQTFPLLSRLPEEDLVRLAEVLEPKDFPAGTEILREGEEGDEMFLLLEGSVDVLKTTPFGEPYVAASLRDDYHCSFGEMALIDGGPRSATVRTRTACKTLCLRRETFQSFCRACPAVGLELLLSVSVSMVHDLRRENENLHVVYQALIEEIENG